MYKELFFIGLLSLFCLGAEEMELTDADVEAFQPALDHLFKFESLSYTLFSSKPLSFAQISKASHIKIQDIWQTLSPDNSFHRVHSGLYYWKKWIAERQIIQFQLIEKSLDRFLTIILINKQEFRRAFDENRELFHKILGTEISADLLMDEIASEKNTLRSALKNDDRLLGILLGYGRRNAEAFFERNKFWNASNNLLRYDDLGFDKQLQPSYGQFSWLYYIQPVQFAGLMHDPETVELIRGYNQASSRISQKFQNEHFVKVILREICRP